ncbi:hemolysin family protein [Paludicola sp. MB14-C6]|uniref:hemolysin family protein n=1 Tax=Paludihabitans sp. MB14-C6 TaxID=3070656 RepID=UPI0027DD52AD|nr:hemolysin family protein [Paludicola sp. MB14-C6]WMJ21993.1 hemolysin family protein [Paludicola sp. MB14-C6]
MDDVGRYLGSIVIFLLLTVIAMFFSGHEAAIVSLNESRLKRLAEEDNPKAKKLLTIKEHQFHFLLKMDICATFCIVAACLVGTYVYSPVLQVLFEKWFGKAGWISVVSFLIIFVLSVFIAFVIGKTLPKKLVANKPESFALFSVDFIRVLGALFKPITFMIMKTAKGFIKLIGINPSSENSDVTEEEIRMLVDVGNENGTIELSEREMINNVFEFNDRTAEEIMTHRTDIIAVEKEDPLSEVIQLGIEEGFSRIPVYDDVIDNIVGIIYVKDLLTLIGTLDISGKKTEEFMRGVIYAPESARCRMLFKELKEKKTHMAVIVDEYGGTAGVVTMEDLLESIVGNIQDEYDQEDDEVKKIDENNYSLDGGLSIEEIEKLFDISLSVDEDTETLGGLIVNTLGRIPSEEEFPTVAVCGVEFTVAKVEDRRVVRVNAKVLPQTQQIEDK